MGQGHFPELSTLPAPPAHLAGLPAWGTMGCIARHQNSVLGGSQPPALTRPGGGGLAGHLFWGLDTAQERQVGSEFGSRPLCPPAAATELYTRTGLRPLSLQPTLATSLTILMRLGLKRPKHTLSQNKCKWPIIIWRNT